MQMVPRLFVIHCIVKHYLLKYQRYSVYKAFYILTGNPHKRLKRSAMSSISSADEDQESVGDDAEQMSTYYKSSMGVAPPSGWQDSQMDPGKEEGLGIKWVESGVKWEETWVKWVEPGVLMELRCMSLKIFVERTMLEHAHQVKCRT